jgi:putative protein kinase ArgK-like GTPase of G3E family
MNGEGVDSLAEAIEKHRNVITVGGELERRRGRQLKAEIVHAVRDRVERQLEETIDFDGQFKNVSRQLASGELDLYTAADMIYDRCFRK